MPVGYESRSRQGLEGEKSRRRRDGGETGTVRVQRSALTGLDPVRKGKAAEDESKNFTEVLVKIANPLGRMRGETPNSECDKADVERK